MLSRTLVIAAAALLAGIQDASARIGETSAETAADNGTGKGNIPCGGGFQSKIVISHPSGRRRPPK
jgi:hypothetical protein